MPSQFSLQLDSHLIWDVYWRRPSTFDRSYVYTRIYVCVNGVPHQSVWSTVNGQVYFFLKKNVTLWYGPPTDHRIHGYGCGIYGSQIHRSPYLACTLRTVRLRGMGTPLMGTILIFASDPLKKIGTDLLGSWWPCQCVWPIKTRLEPRPRLKPDE
jgi:hypothetical protein